MGHHCCSKQKVKRGLWSPEEDEKLVKHITSHGHGCWSSVPKQAGLQRCGKSCRLRWINYLRPDLKRGSFSAQEERIIIDVHRILGNRWAQIAKHLPGRTDNEVKNFWNSCIKKKLIAQGLDPKTHNLIPSHYPNNSTCNLPQQQTTTPFTINTTMKMGETIRDNYIDMNPSFITFPGNHPPLHESITNPTFQSQDPTLLWNFKDQNSHRSMDFLNQTSLENTPISSSINPPGSGFIDENSFWANSVEPSEEAPKQKPTEQQQQQQEQEQQPPPKMCQMGFDETNVEKGQEMGTLYNSSSNFDLDFVESTLMPMYCNVSSMDEFQWDY